MNFDDLLFAMKDVADVATKKTEEVVGITKIKLEKCRVEKEVQDMYKKIGQATYQSRIDGCKNEEYINSLCDTIKDQLQYLQELDKEIADKKDMVICDNCKQQNERDNVYCKRCGSKIKTEQF